VYYFEKEYEKAEELFVQVSENILNLLKRNFVFLLELEEEEFQTKHSNEFFSHNSFVLFRQNDKPSSPSGVTDKNLKPL